MTDSAPAQHGPADVERRRLILGGAGRLTLSVAALALPGCANGAPPGPVVDKSGDDSALLNNVLGVEFEAVAAYDAVLARATLSTAERDLATAFRADHMKHAEAIAAAIKRAGGLPPERSPQDQPFTAIELGGR